MSKTWNGVFCALWTPTDQQGNLMESALRDHLLFLERGGVHGLLILGSTGEFLWLDRARRKALTAAVLWQVRGLKTMVNISHLQPKVVAEFGIHAQELGADAVTILPPYFFPMNQDDLVEFFVHAGKESELPLFLYNFPERTGNRISLETISAVADRVQVAGVKQSGAEFSYHGPLVQLGKEKNFCVLTGADTRQIETMAMGSIGCVSGLSNAVPELVCGVYGGVASGDQEAARVNQERLGILSAALAGLPFPLDVAAAMAARSLEVGARKTPRGPTTEATFRRVVDHVRELYQEWNLV